MNDSLEMEQTDCPLCGSDRSRLTVTARDWRHGFPGEFSYLRCLNCDLVYACPRVPPQRISEYYPDTYASFAPPAGPLKVFSPGERQGWFKRLRRDALACRCGGQIGSKSWRTQTGLLRHVLAWAVSLLVSCRKSPLHFGGDALRLLDVGAGTGSFLRQLHSLGWIVEGIEPDERALVPCRESGLKVECATIETATLVPESYDVVTMWQTLEHVAQPARALEKIEEALVPGGLFVGSTPNAASLNRVLQGAFWWGYDPPRHYVVFSPRSLAHGFSNARLDLRWYYCLSSEKSITAARRFRRLARGEIHDSTVSPGVIPTVVLRVWVRLLDRLGLGDNLWFVGQKPTRR